MKTLKQRSKIPKISQKYTKTLNGKLRPKTIELEEKVGLQQAKHVAPIVEL